jgi:hypothetical protein
MCLQVLDNSKMDSTPHKKIAPCIWRFAKGLMPGLFKNNTAKGANA